MHLTVLSRKGIALPDTIPPSMLPKGRGPATQGNRGAPSSGLDPLGLPPLEGAPSDDYLLNDPMSVMNDLATRAGKAPPPNLAAPPMVTTPAPMLTTQKTGEQPPSWG